MSVFRRALSLRLLVIAAVALTAASLVRIAEVRKGASAIPQYPGAREAGGRIRYLPRLLSWDDRASARVQRVFAFPGAARLGTIGRDANRQLSAQGWYLVTPENLEIIEEPQVIVWQRDPDERLDLNRVWPIEGMTRAQRLFGGTFPEEFLDSPLVIEWSWALGGPRSTRPLMPAKPIVRNPAY